jgi:hypothetical protein
VNKTIFSRWYVLHRSINSMCKPTTESKIIENRVSYLQNLSKTNWQFGVSELLRTWRTVRNNSRCIIDVRYVDWNVLTFWPGQNQDN